MTSGLEMERVYSQRKRQVKEKISKEKVERKGKWGSIRYKQANNTYSTKIEIKNRMKGRITPRSPDGATAGGSRTLFGSAGLAK